MGAQIFRSNSIRPIVVLVATVAATAVVALLTARSASATAWYCYYCGPAWLTPGETHTSSFDPPSCLLWHGNHLDKSVVALGTLAWIDGGGTWRASVKTYEVNMTYFVSPYDWRKSLLGKNSSTVGYSGNMQGGIDQVPGCV